MKVFLKVLNSLKKSRTGNPYLNCQYDKGWNDAIAKVEELISSYNVSDMWIPADVKLPPEPEKGILLGDLPEYIVTLRGASLATSLLYIGDDTWLETGEYADRTEPYTSVIAWMPMPEAYKEKGDKA